MNYSPQSLGFHAWLSPTGELFRVEYWEHDRWVFEYLKKDVCEIERAGWIRIGDSMMIDYHDFNPTAYQLQKLISLGYIVEIYNGKWRYEIPQGDEWFYNIPFAKGSNSYVV